MFARTKRLMLRPGWAEDASALFRGIADPAIVRNLASAPWPYRPEDAEAFLATNRRPHEPALLIVRRSHDGPEPVGTIGLARRENGEIELGYWIARPYWGRGYATEAGRAMLAIARDTLRLDRVHAGHFVDNPASGRVLEKIGFRATGIVAPRFSAGRGATALCRLFRIDFGETCAPAEARDERVLEMVAAA